MNAKSVAQYALLVIVVLAAFLYLASKFGVI